MSTVSFHPKRLKVFSHSTHTTYIMCRNTCCQKKKKNSQNCHVQAHAFYKSNSKWHEMTLSSTIFWLKICAGALLGTTMILSANLSFSVFRLLFFFLTNLKMFFEQISKFSISLLHLFAFYIKVMVGRHISRCTVVKINDCLYQ